MSHEVVNEDCIFGLNKLWNKDVKADIIITSPPYKDSDNYSENLIRSVAFRCFEILDNNSLCFVNFGSLAEDKFRPFKVCQMFVENGFELNDTIVWVKNHYKPIQGSKRLNNLTEFIFMLYKGKMPKLDRLSIGVPYADKSNVKRFADGRDLKCGGNVWYIDYETIQKSSQKLHNDRFPIDLPARCIKLSGIKEESLVLDPFAGSGSTGVAAKQLGMNFIGFEINQQMAEIARKRINSVNL